MEAGSSPWGDKSHLCPQGHQDFPQPFSNSFLNKQTPSARQRRRQIDENASKTTDFDAILDYNGYDGVLHRCFQGLNGDERLSVDQTTTGTGLLSRKPNDSLSRTTVIPFSPPLLSPQDFYSGVSVH